jgi:6-phosphogluconolactonase (cycloisomerase 2 family)
MSTSSTLRRRSLRSRITLLSLSSAVAATTGFAALGAASASASPRPANFASGQSGFVYTQTNQATGNAVLAYQTGPGGTLTLVGTYPTGGTGTGKSPGSQGGVVLGDNGTLLAAVNGGSNSVSVFSVSPNGSLQLVQTTPSGGVDPISATIHGNWVYALNAGAAATATNAAVAPNIDGFIVGNRFLSGLSDVQPLNAAAASPEQIGFSPDGRSILVTEKASSTIDVYPVDRFGVAGPAVTTTLTAGTGPYGFEFTPNGTAVISEAAINSVATFQVSPTGTLDQISSVIDTGQVAPCWVALTPDGSVAFAANAHSGTVSSISVAPNGTLALINAVAATTGGVDTDLVVGGNNSLYVSDQPNFESSTISAPGALSTPIDAVTGLPTGTFGLAASTPGQPFGRGF